MADIASSLLLEERVRAQAAAFMPDVEVSTLLPATGRLDRHASLASSRQSTPNTTEEVASSAPPTVQRGRLDRHASMDDDAVPLAAMSALGRSAAAAAARKDAVAADWWSKASPAPAGAPSALDAAAAAAQRGRSSGCNVVAARQLGTKNKSRCFQFSRF